MKSPRGDYVTLGELRRRKISISTLFPGLYTMLGLVLIYINHTSNEELLKIGIPVFYQLPVLDAFLRAIILGLVNFTVISFFVDQAVRKKKLSRMVTGRFANRFFLEEKPKEHEINAHFTASVSALFYFATCIIALFLTPGAINPNFIIVTFSLGSVTSLSIWTYIFFPECPLQQFWSIKRLELEHATWLEITRQLIFIGMASATGLVIYGVVSWVLNNPQSIASTQAFQIPLFTLASVCIYIYVGFVLGVISPTLIFVGKIRERIEEVAAGEQLRSTNAG